MPLEVPVAAVFEQQRDKPTAIAMIAAASAELVQQAAMPDARERVALLRVDAAEIDRFVNEAGELSIARSRIEGEMSTFRRALVDHDHATTGSPGQRQVRGGEVVRRDAVARRDASGDRCI